MAGANDAAHGRAIYVENCAPCHGLAGDGEGPLARVLEVPPANLQKLWKRYGNPLPEDQIAQFIDGRIEVPAHGPRDMPVWSDRQVKEQIGDLVDYLQSIQIRYTLHGGS
jgi:mono/diheme cytochrome c family protein